MKSKSAVFNTYRYVRFPIIIYSFPYTYYTYSYKKKNDSQRHLSGTPSLNGENVETGICLFNSDILVISMQTIGWAFSRFYVSDRQTHNTNTQTHLHLYVYIKLRITRTYRYSFYPYWKASKSRSRTSRVAMNNVECFPAVVRRPTLQYCTFHNPRCVPHFTVHLSTNTSLLQHSDWWTSFSTTTRALCILRLL